MSEIPTSSEMENRNNNSKALMPVTPMRSPAMLSRRSDVEEKKVLQTINIKLQVKVHNLENEIGRLKEEVQGYKGKSFLYESLTKDLASLRTQLDKTALALLKKCEAYDTLKKELAEIRREYRISPINTQQTPKKITVLSHQPAGNVKRKLAIYQDIMDMSDDESIQSTSKRSSRPSIGSCGNLVKQISVEEAMPSCLQVYSTSTAPLRNRVLMKLHTLKSASTESLESIGRKSMKAEETKATPANTKSCAPSKKMVKSNLDSSLQSSKGGVVKAPPSIRPALGQNNGRVVKVNTSIKKSNSSCSSKSGSSRPAFRF